MLLTPLKVLVPAWGPDPRPAQGGDPGDPVHILQLRWSSDDGDRLLVEKKVLAPPPAIPDFHVIEIPLIHLRSRSRVVQLYYTVLSGETGLTHNTSRVTITIDLEAPTLIAPTDKAQFVVPPMPAIDAQYLTNHQPTAFYIPVYNVRAPNDRVEFFLSNTPEPPLKPADGGSLVNFSTTPWTASLNSDAFRGLNAGPAFVSYRVYDETGNYSNMSAGLPFVLGLGLPAPSIRPPIYNDQLIKRDDARVNEGGGVFVRIDGYPGGSVAARHEVIVYWDDRPTTRRVVSQLPFDVDIPWTVLRGPAAVLQAQTVQVRYEIYGLNPTPTPSLSLPVNVNLTIAGQDHPNAPALLNPTLAPVEIVGRTATDTLGDTDRGYPVRVRVRLFDTPKVGESLNLFWDGVGPVSTYLVQAGDTAGSRVYFPDVPWSVVNSTSVTSYSVHYTTTNGFNEQRSPTTNVSTRFIPLPAPVIQHTLYNGYLNCNSKTDLVNGVPWSMLGNGVRWKIPANSNIREGDTVKCTWQGFNENNWSTVNTNVVVSRSLRWEQANTVAGAVIVFDSFDKVLLPLRRLCSATATYQVWRDDELVTESLPGKVRVDLTYGSSLYCSPNGLVSG
ncbi:hypothetical protein FW764_23535 [Pseudomonas sp. 1152_12]